MLKQAIVNARMEPKLKNEAESILDDVGLSSSEAIRIFYRQICLRRGLPFNVKIPNKATLEAVREIRSGEAKKFNSVDELFDDLDS